MNQNRVTGQWIDSQRRALAAAVVARQYELQLHLRDQYGDGGKAKCIQDTQYHLSYLATAIHFCSPALFAQYVTWAKEMLAAYGVATEDVQRNLVCLREVLNERLPADMRDLALPYVGAALDSLARPPNVSLSFLDGTDELTQLARRYLDALQRTQRDEAIRLILDAVKSGVPISEIYLQVFQRCQREVGRLWQSRQITVAQEHYCTAATQLAMSLLYQQLFAQPKTGRRLVAASVTGELHEVGLRIVTDLFESAGWDTVYLGANLPPDGVLDAVAEHRPDLLLISATMTFHLESVQRLIALVRASEAGQNVKIMVGGYPCNIDTELWKRIGADGYACDAAEALTTADRLLESRELVQSQAMTQGDVSPEMESTEDGGPAPQDEVAIYDELSRLNNELLTAQREIARKHAQLALLNDRLKDADRRKDEFLATLAHELRNPLAPIRTGLDLMRMSAGDQTLHEQVREMMAGQVRHLVRLVDDLLDVSRITSGKLTLQKSQVDLATVVQSAVDATHSVIDAAGHELTVALPSQRIPLYADPTRLGQVLSNLLTNAARYTTPGGKITLTAERECGDIAIKVKDSGIGIAAEMLDRIFDMFTQADRSTERSQSGLGIGLMLVKRLTEMHGGSVQARSEGVGEGSEFLVRIPALIEPAGQSPEVDAPAAVGGLKILVVDDSKDAAKMLQIMLQTAGNEVRTAHDGLEAIERAADFRPDVVLMDLGMPRLNGYDTARQLRQHAWGTEMVLVALTGWGQDEDKQRTREAGFDHHLVKPVEFVALYKLLQQTASHQLGSK